MSSNDPPGPLCCAALNALCFITFMMTIPKLTITTDNSFKAKLCKIMLVTADASSDGELDEIAVAEGLVLASPPRVLEIRRSCRSSNSTLR